jgi:hypothetical protein
MGPHAVRLKPCPDESAYPESVVQKRPEHLLRPLIAYC